jgi:ribosome biogenesis GTPase
LAKQGRVIKSTGSWYQVALESGDHINVRIPGKFRLNIKEQTNPLAVGDIVEIEEVEDGTGIITSIKDRFNKITRKATHGRRGEHIIAANIDQAFVIQSIRNPAYKTGFIDRFLVTCEAYDIPPFIVINKMDLAKSKDLEQLEKVREVYESLEYPFVTCSIIDKNSIDVIANLLKDKISLFIGPSGVGKTSILNAIDPEINRAVGLVSEYSKKGKHTTTFAELVPLRYGGYLVDTPGIREFGLVNIEPREVALLFPEIEEKQHDCKFYNCTHIHEPGCAVKEAVKHGDIAESRYKSYKNMILSFEE